MGGRCKGKMMRAEEFLKLLPEEVRKDIIALELSDKPPKLKGNNLPRIEDYDMIELSEFSFEIWEALKENLQNKRTKNE